MVKEKIFNKYSSRGPGYHWEQISINPFKRNSFVVARYQKIIELLEKESGSIKDKHILDIGCGDGALSYLLSLRGAIVTGIDPSKEAILFAKDKFANKKIKNIELFVEDFMKKDFKDHKYDIIISTEVIEHIKEPNKMLRKTKDLIAPKGILVVTTPIRITKTPLDEMHYREWFVEDFSCEIQQEYSSAYFYYSHPLFWFELYLKSFAFRVLINMLSYFYNPFSKNKGWRYFSLQYAVCRV